MRQSSNIVCLFCCLGGREEGGLLQHTVDTSAGHGVYTPCSLGGSGRGGGGACGRAGASVGGCRRGLGY